MKVLTRDDPLFVQLQAELDGWYRQTADTSPTASARPAPSPLAIFAYRRRGEDLFSLNARLNMPYDTLVTLNAAASRAEFEALPRVLVPTRPGLFVCDPPATALEDMMLSSRVERGLARERVVVQRGDRRVSLWFFPGESFNAVERAYFLRILYDFPIMRGSITSRYGSRADPFTGDPSFHNGIDIGAPVGTAGPRRARRDGRRGRRERDPGATTWSSPTPEAGSRCTGTCRRSRWPPARRSPPGRSIGEVGSTGQVHRAAPALRGPAQGQRGRPVPAARVQKMIDLNSPFDDNRGVGALV